MNLAKQSGDSACSGNRVRKSRVSFPPVSELDTLLDMVNRWMVIDIQDWLDKIEQLETKYAPFISKIRQLIIFFDFGEIRERLNSSIGKTNQ